jgi:outer membrane protein assembly factor BamB
MDKTTLAVFALVSGAVLAPQVASFAAAGAGWPQWGQSSEHQGTVATIGQPAAQIVAEMIFDPFTVSEQSDPLASRELRVHYQVPLVAGEDVFMEIKTGSYYSIATWETQTWGEKGLRWQEGSLRTMWIWQSDWKPVPYQSFSSGRGPALEPVFHAALAGGFIYVPGAGGTVDKLDRGNGYLQTHINPFGPEVDPSIFLTGPITADTGGAIYYHAVKLVTGSQGSAWDHDVANSWLVKVDADGHVAKATYASLVPGAPGPTEPCLGVFATADLPWPPNPDAVPPSFPCGSVRTGLNVAPAVAPDGTIYVPAVHHFNSRTAYLLAVNPDLTPKWQTSLRDRFDDGCDADLPRSGTPGGCRAGAHGGVDPAQNRPGAGRILDDGTSSPAIAPDGSIFFGTYSRYNWAQGHIMKFSPAGQFLAAYPFGWDITPAIYIHGGTYSIVTKDNHYGGRGSYCDDEALCPPDRTASDPANPEAFFITQLSKDLVPEWRYQNSNTLSCSRDTSGHITCVSDHPHGFDWCINAPAVDGDGVVYAGSEDGYLYAINQGGSVRDRLFLELALEAAYTPLAIGPDGKIYAENKGTLFVLGQALPSGGKGARPIGGRRRAARPLD